MNEKAEKKFREMLLDLCSLQDDVTHCNEKGVHIGYYVKETHLAIAKRDALMEEIVSFVEGLSDPARKTNNDERKNYCLDNDPEV